MRDRNLLIKKIENPDSFAIYGAGMMGKSLYSVLSDYPYKKCIMAFIVKTLEGNPQQINGIDIISLCNADRFKHLPILVALHEKHISGALEDLKSNGFDNITPVSFDSDLWSDIREKWMIKNGLLNYKVINMMKRKDIHVYVVNSEFDKTLSEEVINSDYEVPIQVGTALAKKIMFDISDNTGENISEKNKQYCELTALYWAWKNDSADYIGISHYRRRFLLDSIDIEKIKNENIDIVVTVPVLNINTVKEQYCIDHSINDWKVMVDAVSSLSPGYLEAVEKVGNGKFYYAYNMFIAKRMIFRNYCSWLFPILEYCEKKIGPKDDIYQNRYIGFLAERLLTIYITKHTELKIAVADKHFIDTKKSVNL